MRILVWHVHGGWMEAFVRGRHEYLLPRTADGGPWGLGRGGRAWPVSAREVDPGALRDEEVDVIVLQRPEELRVAEDLLGRRPGRDVPAVFVEHNTPGGQVPFSVHPLADRDDIPVAHVTHFNALFWDTGRAPTTVIEHGIPDPGPLYTGELRRLAVAVNDPVRRGRAVGADLLPAFATEAGLDVFGMGLDGLGAHLGLDGDQLAAHGDLPTARLHDELARRRAYLHPMRWTSLGLSLLEAMHLGMPVVVLATTEAIRAVPPEAGAVSTDVAELAHAARRLLDDPDAAKRAGAVAREAALARYGLGRFLADWDDLLEEVAGTTRRAGGSRVTTDDRGRTGRRRSA